MTGGKTFADLAIGDTFYCHGDYKMKIPPKEGVNACQIHVCHPDDDATYWIEPDEPVKRAAFREIGGKTRPYVLPM